MMILRFFIFYFLLSMSFVLSAGSMGPLTDNTRAKFFLGLGGSYNALQVKQNLYAIGVANYTGSFEGSGVAQGPAGVFNGNESGLAPQVQAGVYKHFLDDNLYGIKLSYQYLGNTTTHKDFTALQTGVVNGQVLVGNLLIQSAQTQINHELLLLPFIGHTFSQNQFYLGAGPALFGVHSNTNGVIGFANLFNSPTDVTGLPANFYNPAWVWGGAAQIGWAYHPSPDWRLDFSYTYAFSQQYDLNNSATFSNFISKDNLTIAGTGYVNTSQNFISQSLALTINKVFSL